MEVQLWRIVRPLLIGNAPQHNSRIKMLHIVRPDDRDRSLCGRTVDGWDMPYWGKTNIKGCSVTSIEITERDFCKVCARAMNGQG